MNKIKDTNPVWVLVIQIILAVFQIVFSQEIQKDLADTLNTERYSVKIINDSIAIIRCPDSTFVKGKIVAEDKNTYLIENEYLGFLKILKTGTGNDTLLSIQKKVFAPDPAKSSTFLNQSAFIQRVYPFEISHTEAVFNSIRASITPSTLIWFEFTIPHDYRDFTFGIKQQLYQTRQENFAVALSGAFTHVTKWDDPFWQYDKGKMQYVVDGELLMSMKFFHNGYFHTGLLYTMQKRYFHYWYDTDGTEYHEYKGNYYHHWGFMACIEAQPFKYVKFFLDYSDGYGVLVNSNLIRNYYYAIGSRFLINRVNLDIGVCQSANLKSSVTRRIKFLPIGRLSVFFGKFRHTEVNK